MNTFSILEFDKILEQLSDCAMSENVKTRCLDLKPSLNETEARRQMEETTQARTINEANGTPPLPTMENLHKVLGLIAVDAMLLPEQIAHVLSFLISCRRMKQYLKKAEMGGTDIAFYGGSLDDLSDLAEEIDRCIINGLVDDRASPALSGIRRRIVNAREQMKLKLEALLKRNRDWFSESFVSVRNGHYTLPVKREHKNNVPGTLIDMSHTGGTCFIEPASVGKLNTELSELLVEEDSEVRRILYTLTALIGDFIPQIKLNIETLETLDFLFAKGKLSIKMKASPVALNTGRRTYLIAGRHPLIDREAVVPLDFEIGGKVNGVVITGPNTGGKTVALKTIGLLSLMAQSGLHIPADKGSTICMNDLVLCDIGDGQSITENLSTFSSHMKNIIEILEKARRESLVLLDELGSGTDPAEGMGLAVAILDELCRKRCQFVVTTHYPEIKEYAAKKPGVMNARMAFDKESLLPLYRLELGEAGESCALHIAERLGMPKNLLLRAREAAYGRREEKIIVPAETAPPQEKMQEVSCIVKAPEQRPKTVPRSETFNIGDSVIVYPQKDIGLVYQRANAKGELGVQIRGVKKLVNHKRVKLHVPAAELYPEDYDFSIVFDTVENRKARRVLDKRHQEGTVVVIKEGEEIK
ncbi:MAG: DNA mismatch repair protein MutS [Clostridiales bacterium]|nr:DNA mismatch repair protein MutS [Clostridiales bacterium]